METISLFWLKFVNMLQIPNTVLFGQLVILSLVWRWFSHRWPLYASRIFCVVGLALSTWYFGIYPVFQGMLVLWLSSQLGARFTPHAPPLLALTLGGFIFVQAFILLGLFSHNLTLAYWLTLLLFLGFVLWRQTIPHLLTNTIRLFRAAATGLAQLNLLESSLLLFAFIFSFLPQTHWDAVQANLYIAKWYNLANNFTALPESLTSLFPQNALGYYTLFTHLGGIKYLSLAFLLPLLLTLGLLQFIAAQLKLPRFARLLITLSLFTPIVVFQASNGYYDNLVLLLLLAAALYLFFLPRSPQRRHLLAAAFLLGFAAGAKYFPLIMVPIPVLLYLRSTQFKLRSWLFALLLCFTSLAPLSLWLVRAYSVTGSPVFPFFQNVFPTPDYWDASDKLEGNFMIQAKTTSLDWLKGGFLTYPYHTYFRSTQFIEGTPGYPTLLYLVVLPLQIFFLSSVLLALIRRRPLSQLEIFFLTSFLAYFGVGLVVRYYRYLWPFQFLWFISTLPLLTPLSQSKLWVGRALTLLGLLLIPLHFLNFIGYYRYYPLDSTKAFRPDYYFSTLTDQTPMAFLNRRSQIDDLVLDASSFPLHRLHFLPRIYTCNWYWTRWPIAIRHPATTFTQFKYLITNANRAPITNYCATIIQAALDSGTYQDVYQDGTYTIYAKQ